MLRFLELKRFKCNYDFVDSLNDVMKISVMIEI